MRIPLLMLLWLPSLALASGSLVIQPQVHGGVRFFTEGSSGGAGNDVLAFTQPSGESLSIQLTPAGAAQCTNGKLVFEGLTLAPRLLQDNQRLICGQPTELAADENKHQVRVRFENEASARRAALPRSSSAQPGRVLLGNLAFTANGDHANYALYLDQSVLDADSPTVTASFNMSRVFLGEIGDKQSASKNVRLTVQKTAEADSAVLPYSLRMESTQQLNNQYRMQADSYFAPYQIFVADQAITPDMTLRRQLPTGASTSDVIDVRFTIKADDTAGVPANTRLKDTITAVITPEG